MTEKLYDMDPHIAEFEATVLSCEKTEDGTYAVILNRTAFFPEEGGQSCDEGTLANQRILHVSIDKENILTHFLALPLTVGDTVTGKLDYSLRFDRMQQHTGEHILSGLIHNRFGFHNVGFHLSNDYTTFDTSGTLSDEEIRTLEADANKVVFSNLKVRAFYPEKEELETLSYRSKMEIDGPVRLVEIPGIDLCACCAPHVDYTGQIGMIKIVDYKNHRCGMRLTILCGMRALSYSTANERTLSRLSRELSVPFERIEEAFCRLKEETLSKQSRINELQEKLLQCRIASLPSPSESNRAILFVDSMDMKAVRNIVNHLTGSYKDYCAVFTGSDECGYNFIIGAGCEGDCSPLSLRLRETVSAKCGGSTKMIQGSVNASKDRLLEIFEI